MLLGLPRHCSLTTMLAEAYTDGFQGIIRKRQTSLTQRVRVSANNFPAIIANRFDGPFEERTTSLHVMTSNWATE